MAIVEEYFGSVSSFADTLAVEYDGINEYVDFGNVLDQTGAAAFSLSCWVKHDALGSQEVYFAKRLPAGGSLGYLLQKRANNTLLFFLEGGGGSLGRVSVVTLSTATWYHICHTYSGNGDVSGCNMYIDAVISNAVLLNGFGGSATNANPFRLGSFSGAPLLGMDGVIDEPSYWNKELTGAEVTEIFNGGTPADLAVHSAVANLVAWPRAEGSTFPTLSDAHGAFDGTMTNMAAGNFVADTPP